MEPGEGIVNYPNSTKISEGIEGFKKSDFVSPEKVLGQDVKIESLPEGIKFYLRGQPIQLGEKQIVTNLYELVREPDGMKLRKEHLEKFVNRIPEDDEISLKYGPSPEGYVWIAKWRDMTGQEMGIMSETIRVSEKWRLRYENEQKRVQSQASVTAQSPAVVPTVNTNNIGTLELLKVMQEGEERAYKNIERMSVIFNQNKPDTPTAVLEKAYETAGKIIEKSIDSNFNFGKKVNAMIKETMIPQQVQEEPEAVADPESEELDRESILEGMPAWLKPFIPQLEAWLSTLLGGGVAGTAVKTLILSSSQYKEIFADKDKFAVAVQGMREYFGDEKAEAVLNLLTAKEKQEKPGSKSKSKGEK